jgi:membrane protein YdbS with pleckstrin-like domain
MAINVTLRKGCRMNNKLLYWIPVIGLLISLFNFEKENGMPDWWSYYQAVMVIALISIATLAVNR